MKDPQPTEYSGVLFRSKSEAIFARALELRGYTWEYEPERWRTEDGWVPDFWAVGLGSRHRIHSMVIEYKPSAVTPAYFNLLTKRLVSLGDKLHDTSEVIVCGNSFNQHPRQAFMRFTTGWGDMEETIKLFKYIDEAARYRFDLIAA